VLDSGKRPRSSYEQISFSGGIRVAQCETQLEIFVPTELTVRKHSDVKPKSSDITRL
jgi:hypothetical protein